MKPGIKFKSGPPATETRTAPHTEDSGPLSRADLAALFERVRRASEAFAAPLAPEDQVIQSMPDVSPTKWHLAHVTWFFEEFVLTKADSSYNPFDPDYAFLFNSYYYTIGQMYARPRRGLISRPTVSQVLDYRAHVSAAVLDLIETANEATYRDFAPLIEIGCRHEEQHQELIYTDIKHVLSCNPTYPAAYPAPAASPVRTVGDLGAPEYLTFEGGLIEIGHPGTDGSGNACFGVFDNETPRHKIWLEPFALADRPVTQGDYLEFIEDGGYGRVALWLSDGWAWINETGREAPLYWIKKDGAWHEFTLAGLRPLDPNKPVSHLSYYEADAYAAWAGARLPSEAEWEHVAAGYPVTGTFAGGAAGTAPEPAPISAEELSQARASKRAVRLFGDVWEWTRTPYEPYPGFKAHEGSLGEYNGKFMCSQYVLRGGSAATPTGHVRLTYRNFFPADAQWQLSGLRLARDL